MNELLKKALNTTDGRSKDSIYNKDEAELICEFLKGRISRGQTATALEIDSANLPPKVVSVLKAAIAHNQIKIDFI